MDNLTNEDYLRIAQSFLEEVREHVDVHMKNQTDGEGLATVDLNELIRGPLTRGEIPMGVNEGRFRAACMYVGKSALGEYIAGIRMDIREREVRRRCVDQNRSSYN